MRLEIRWLASKSHRYVTSISGNRFASWHAWHYIEMVWSVFGDQIKVIQFFSTQKNRKRKQKLNSPRLNFPVLSLQELCCRTIVRRTSVYAIDTLPLPPSVKSNLKSYALTSSQCINTLSNPKKGSRCKTPTLPNSSTRSSCSIS